MSQRPELIVIIPVYNEEEIIAEVVQSWHVMLDGLNIPYEMHLYNDGSKDNTGELLDTIALNLGKVFVHHQANKGHGPTILQGYRAHGDAEWLFQTDSDNEMDPAFFQQLFKAAANIPDLSGRYDQRRRDPESSIMEDKPIGHYTIILCQ